MQDKIKKWLGNSCQLTILTGDASSRRYWRELPQGRIICHDPKKESLANFVTIQSFLKRNNISVPEIYKTDQNQGFLLLDDLGDETLLICLSSASHTQEYKQYQNSIDILLNMQKSNEIPEIVQNRAFDKEKFLLEIDMTLDYFADQILGLTKAQVNEIRSDYIRIIESLIIQPRTFSHRDYHSRNIMLNNNKLIVIDFQDARMGLPHYDLVSLLEDCYIDTGSVNRKKLINYYWEKREKTLFPYTDIEDFYEIYYQTLLQRVFKAIGSFSYIYKTRGDIRYLKYIGFAMEKIRRTLRDLKIENNLKETLLRPYYES